MILIVTNLLDLFSAAKVTVVNPGKPDMHITVKDGRELKRYEANGTIGKGQGVGAGIIQSAVRSDRII